jgi:hypothetical protein
MQQGLGWVGWTPDVFWNATLSELYAAVVGKREFVDKIPPTKPASELESEFGGLLERVREAQRAEAKAANERDR